MLMNFVVAFFFFAAFDQEKLSDLRQVVLLRN